MTLDVQQRADQQSGRCHWQGLFAAVAYGIFSASMAFANKVVMNTYQFNFPFALMALQMLVSLVVIKAMVVVGLTNIPSYTLERGRTFAVASVCSALHSSLSLIALEGMNIPMYSAVKRCTPLVNLVLSVVVLHKPWPSYVIVWSILLITFGCLIAGIGDLQFETQAYTFGFFSVVVQGLYQTFIQKAAEKNLSVLDIFQLNCYNCLPMFAIGSLLSHEPMDILRYRSLNDGGFIFCLLLVIFVGSLLNYTLFLSTSLNTALTTSLVGVLKSVLQTVVGFFTFGGVTFNPVIIAGISLNTIGGVMYTYGKLSTTTQEATSARKRATDDDEEKLIPPDESIQSA